MVKKTLLCFFVFTLASTTALFAANRPVVAHATHIIKGRVVQAAEPASQHKLFSNVGPAANEYQLSGYFVAGPTSALGTSQFMAVPFTLGSTGYNLTLVKVPIQWYGTGHNTAQLCLYSDSGANSPGTQIGNCVTKNNLPAFGTTNTLTTYNFTSQSLALSPSTQYWIVGQTPSTGAKADAMMVWDGESISLGFNVGNAGWGSFQPDFMSVMAAFGQ